MLKQFKIIILAPTCFGSRRNHHQRAVLCLAKTTIMVFLCFFGVDAFYVMATYQPVVQACSPKIRLVFQGIKVFDNWYSSLVFLSQAVRVFP